MAGEVRQGVCRIQSLGKVGSECYEAACALCQLDLCQSRLSPGPPSIHGPLLQPIEIYLPQKIKLLKAAVFPLARPQSHRWLKEMGARYRNFGICVRPFTLIVVGGWYLMEARWRWRNGLITGTIS